MRNGFTLNRRVLGLVVIVLAASAFQLGHTLLQPSDVRAQEKSQKFAFFTASQVFGLVQEQRARFCVGSLSSRGPELDWKIVMSDERGNLLLQLPETHSPSGEWRCLDAPRSSLNVVGEPGTGRVQVAASHLVKAPAGTQPSQMIGSFEIVNPDGTSAGAVAGVLYAAFHNND